jgi:hypothetical protein
VRFSGGSSMSFPGTGRRRRRSAAADLNPRTARRRVLRQRANPRGDADAV